MIGRAIGAAGGAGSAVAVPAAPAVEALAVRAAPAVEAVAVPAVAVLAVPSCDTRTRTRGSRCAAGARDEASPCSPPHLGVARLRLRPCSRESFVIV